MRMTGPGDGMTTDQPIVVERRPRTVALLVMCLAIMLGGVGHILIERSASRATRKAEAADARARDADKRAADAISGMAGSREKVDRLDAKLAEERSRREALERQVRSLGAEPVTVSSGSTREEAPPGASPFPSPSASTPPPPSHPPSRAPTPRPTTPSPSPSCPLPICLPPIPLAASMSTPSPTVGPSPS